MRVAEFLDKHWACLSATYSPLQVPLVRAHLQAPGPLHPRKLQRRWPQPEKTRPMNRCLGIPLAPEA